LARLRRAKRNLGFYWDFILWQAPYSASRLDNSDLAPRLKKTQNPDFAAAKRRQNQGFGFWYKI
jgi:hypothetical protein